MNNGLPLFFHALLNFTLEQRCTHGTVLGDLGKFSAVYARTLFCNIFKVFEAKKPLMCLF